MGQFHGQVCEVCGETATEVSRDVREVESDTKWAEWELDGPEHYRCKDHPRMSQVYRLTPEGEYYRDSVIPGLNRAAVRRLKEYMRRQETAAPRAEEISPKMVMQDCERIRARLLRATKDPVARDQIKHPSYYCAICPRCGKLTFTRARVYCQGKPYLVKHGGCEAIVVWHKEYLGQSLSELPLYLVS